MNTNTERLTVRVPQGWKDELAKIGEQDDRDTSYMVRRALIMVYPKLKEAKDGRARLPQANN